MKLHLPKLLLTAVLAACVSPAAWATSDSTANSGWNVIKDGSGKIVDDSYGIGDATIQSIDTADSAAVAGSNLFLRSNNSIDTATVNTLTLTRNLTIDGWHSEAAMHPEFAELTINSLSVSNNAALNILAKNVVTIKSISGVLQGAIGGTLKLDTGSEVSFDCATGRITGNGSDVGTIVIADGTTVKLNGTNTGTWGCQAAISSKINIEAGGELKLLAKDMLGFDHNSEGQPVPSITLIGSQDKLATITMQDESGNGYKQTLSTDLFLNGNTLTNGGQFETFGGKIVATNTNNRISSELLIFNDVEIEVTNISDALELTDKITQGAGTGSFTKSGNGILTLSGDEITFYKSFTNAAGETVLEKGGRFNDVINITGGKLSVGGDITIGKAINLTGTGILDLGDGHTVELSSLEGFAIAERKPVNGAIDTNGFAYIQTDYTIIDGVTDSNVIGVATFKIGSGDAAQDINVSNGIYSVVSADLTAYIVNKGDVLTSSADVAGATRFLVYSHENQDAGNLIIDSDVGDLTASQILTTTEGDGNIILKTDVSLKDVATVATGGLTIGDGVTERTLTIGAAWGRNEDYSSKTSIASFSSVTLDKGVIIHNAAPSIINDLTVSANGGKLKVYDQDKETPIQLKGKTTLNGDLNIETYWKYNVNIEALTGSGNLTAASNGANESDSATISINALQDYSGAISLTKGQGSAKLSVTATEAEVQLAGLSLMKGASGLFTVTNDANTKNIALGDVTLTGGSILTVWNKSAAGEAEIDTLTVEGAATLATYRDASCFNGTFNILKLNSQGENAELILKNGSKTTSATVYNIAGGTYNGTLNLECDSPRDAQRYLELNVNDKTVLAGAVIGFKDPSTTNVADSKYDNYDVNRGYDWNASDQNITLGLGVDSVQVAGLSGTTTKAATIKSTETGTTRTLEINTAQGAEYVTNAKIDATVNLVKSGVGKQTLAGEVESKSLSVNGGELALSGTEVLTLTSLAVQSGATLTVDTVRVGSVVESRAASAGATASLQGGATVVGNLDLSRATSLTLSAITPEAPVTITGTLTLSGGTTALTGDVVAQINAMTADTQLNLFKVGSFATDLVATMADTTGTQWALGAVFTNTEWQTNDQLFLAYDDVNGFVYVLNTASIPEPTTSTLGLLALAALAARRRRK